MKLERIHHHGRHSRCAASRCFYAGVLGLVNQVKVDAS